MRIFPQNYKNGFFLFYTAYGLNHRNRDTFIINYPSRSYTRIRSVYFIQIYGYVLLEYILICLDYNVKKKCVEADIFDPALTICLVRWFKDVHMQKFSQVRRIWTSCWIGTSSKYDSVQPIQVTTSSCIYSWKHRISTAKSKRNDTYKLLFLILQVGQRTSRITLKWSFIDVSK